jgi:hypothetical protein
MHIIFFALHGFPSINLGKYFAVILSKSPNRKQNTVVGVVEVNRGVVVANMFLYSKCRKMVSDGRLWEM